jgi:hypothetical protein
MKPEGRRMIMGGSAAEFSERSALPRMVASVARPS